MRQDELLFAANAAASGLADPAKFAALAAGRAAAVAHVAAHDLGAAARLERSAALRPPLRLRHAPGSEGGSEKDSPGKFENWFFMTSV